MRLFFTSVYWSQACFRDFICWITRQIPTLERLKFVLGVLVLSPFLAMPSYAADSAPPAKKVGWLWNNAGEPFFVYPVAGCSYEPLFDTFSSIMAKKDYAWIGTFVDVQATSAQFQIERVIRGDLRQTGVTMHVSWSPEHFGCIPTFAKGERWIYSGPLLTDASVQIPTGAQVVALQSGDLQDQSPCASNLDCTIVAYACNRVVATHVRNQLSMRQKLNTMFGNPALLECPVVSANPPKWPICEPTTRKCSIVSVR